MAEIKKDCFAYSKLSNRCMALKELYCRKKECGFYKKSGSLCNGCKNKGSLECGKCKGARTGMKM